MKKTIKRTYRINTSNKTKKSKTINNNTNIIHILTLVKDYYKEQNDKIRVNTYNRAIYQIKKWNKQITKGNELEHLEGIGKGMIGKIDTIISSGTLPIIKDKNIIDTQDKNIYNKDKDKSNKKEKELQTILGFNKTFINEIKNKHDARTINDFRKYINDKVTHNTIKLTHIQELGLKYYEDLNDLIPRSEITYLGNILKKQIDNMENTHITSFISGSYPSNTKKYSKDIDIIIVNMDDTMDDTDTLKTINHSGTLKNIISNINKNSVSESKSVSESESESEYKNKIDLEIISLGETKFMGLLHSPISNKMRHIDIRLVNLEAFPYTWFYYSSGQIFNILIRKKLKQKGYKLNEYGLFKNNIKVKLDVSPEYKMKKIMKNNNKNNEKELLDYVETIEREIFKLADMDYKTVSERY
jgi:DNA polymerase/3'-5' exonuclease PolX